MLGRSEQKEGAQLDLLLPARSHKVGEVRGGLFLVFCNDGGGVRWVQPSSRDGPPGERVELFSHLEADSVTVF